MRELPLRDRSKHDTIEGLVVYSMDGTPFWLDEVVEIEPHPGDRKYYTQVKLRDKRHYAIHGPCSVWEKALRWNGPEDDFNI